MAWKRDIIQHPLDHLEVYAFLSFALIHKITNMVMSSSGLKVTPGGSTLATLRVVVKPVVPAGGWAPKTSHGMKSLSTTTCKKISSNCAHNQPSDLKVTQRIIRKTGFSRGCKR